MSLYHKFQILSISILIFIAFFPLTIAAPSNRTNHEDFGESKHFIDEEKENGEIKRNGEGRMEEVLDELADLADEEKAKIEELEEQNEQFKYELEAMGVNVEEEDGERGEDKRKAEIGMNEREPRDEENEEREEEEKSEDESEEKSEEPNNLKKVSKTNERNDHLRMPFPRNEFNIQQTINNYSDGKISVRNNN